MPSAEEDVWLSEGTDEGILTYTIFEGEGDENNSGHAPVERLPIPESELPWTVTVLHVRLIIKITPLKNRINERHFAWYFSVIFYFCFDHLQCI